MSFRISPVRRHHFGDFEADLSTCELFKAGQRLAIQEKPFQILALLLEVRGQLLSREEICRALWPDVCVETDHCLNTAIRKLRIVLEDTSNPPKVIETMRNHGYRLLVPVRSESAASDGDQPAQNRPALAVIPFQNLSGESDEFFADGLTEQLIAQLGRQQQMRVIAPLSSMQYKHTNKNPVQVGRELGVDYLLAGSVLRNGKRLRVTAKLVRTRDQSCAWADSYARDEADIFFIQDTLTNQIARAILHAVPSAVGPNPHMTTAPSVYENYLKGCCFAAKWAEPDMGKARGYFEQVIADDPGFAPAHASMAILYAGLIQFGTVPPAIAHQGVKSASSKALALSHELPEAHLALGWAQLFYEADLAAAESSFVRALELNPSCANAYLGYSQVLTVRFNHDQAIPVMLHARMLDPLSPMVGTIVGCNYYYARQYKEALHHLEECLEMQPSFGIGHGVTGWVYQAMGDMGTALCCYRAAVRCCPESSLILVQLAQALAFAGHHREARRTLAQILRARQHGSVPSWWIALVYLGLGQVSQALEWLRVAFREGCGWRVLCGIDPRLDPLADNAEFKQLLAEIGNSTRLGTISDQESASRSRLS